MAAFGAGLVESAPVGPVIVTEELINAFRWVTGKENILFGIARAALSWLAGRAALSTQVLAERLMLVIYGYESFLRNIAAVRAGGCHNSGMVTSPSPRRRRARSRSRTLSVDSIVSVGIRIARDDGLGALTMRRVAEELGAGVMSLYRHVTDRRELLLRMLDEVALGIDWNAPAGDPRERIATIMNGTHDAFRRDPWAAQVVATEGLASPHILPLVDALFGALLEARLSARQAVEGYALLFQYTYGEVLDLHRARADTVGRQLVRTADPRRYPQIARIVGVVGERDDREYFAANLTRILDGLLDTALEVS